MRGDLSYPIPMIKIRQILLPSLSFFLMACGSPTDNPVQSQPIQKNGVSQQSFGNLGYTVEHRWVSGPYSNINQKSVLAVYIKDASGNIVSLPEGLELSFYSTMPSMGHPMDDAGFFEEGPGVYINRNIRFNMPGDWKHELWILNSDYDKVDELHWLEII